MIKITETNADFLRLEDGTELYYSEWNGEKFITKENGAETSYLPIYDPNQNQNGCYDILGFDKI